MLFNEGVYTNVNSSLMSEGKLDKASHFKLHSNVLGSASNERLCRLRDQVYVICPQFCCGEFWESSSQFCCPNNFKPIRYLFFYLLTAFVTLFATVVIYLIVEVMVGHSISTELEGLFAISNSIRSSEGTNLDDDSSLDEFLDAVIRSESRHDKQLLNRHSQSFKDMSKMNSMKRLAKRKAI